MYNLTESPVNYHGVYILFIEDSINLSYEVDDDIEFDVTIKKDGLLDFLKRHKIKALSDVDMFTIMDEEDYQDSVR